MGRKIISAADGITTRIDKVPGIYLSKCHLPILLTEKVSQHLGLHALGLHCIKTHGIGSTLSDICQHRSFVGQREASHALFGNIQKLYAIGLPVHTIQFTAVAVFGKDIHVSIGATPVIAHHIRIEILGDGNNLLVRERHHV